MKDATPLISKKAWFPAALAALMSTTACGGGAGTDDDPAVDPTDDGSNLGQPTDDGTDSADPSDPMAEAPTVTIECDATDDGLITADEMPLQAGLTAKFAIAQNVSFDTAGTVDADGNRVWDLSEAFASDREVDVSTFAVDGEWYAETFPSASYSGELSEAASALGVSLLGVFELDDSALEILGVVSPTDTTRTELIYDPPVTAMAFPLAPGATWTLDTTATGITNGAIPTALSQTYESIVDASGRLVLSIGTFDVMRVSTVQTTTVAGFSTTVRTFQFVAECLGPLATVTSGPNEAEPEFTSVLEVQRLTQQ